jgi:2'-5' RNA ligase
VGLRLFIGAFPPDSARRLLEESLDGFRLKNPGLRWVEPSQWHVTLFFLGATQDFRMEILRKRLGADLAALSSFQVELGGAGSFPEGGNPKALFVGAGRNPESWAPLESALRPLVTAMDFTLEARPFHPHLTLARVKDPAAGVEALERIRQRLEEFKAPWTVDSIRLVSSRLGATGATYETIGTFKLK